MNTRQILAILAFAAIVSPCLLSSVLAETINVSEYVNFAIGYRWNYQQSLYPGPWSVEVDSMSSKNGNTVFLLQEYDSGDHKNDQRYIKSDFTSGMYDVGGLDDYGQITQEEFFWEPPIPRLLHDFVPGEQYPFVSDTWGQSINGTLQVVKESVTVPLGTFNDTWKTSQSFDGFGIYNTWWYSKGVGLVKREQGDGNVWELTSVSFPISFSPGDANHDGVVSAGDYASVQANFGNTGPAGILGDANGDGVVSAGDYASVQANYGNIAAGAGISNTPEPATLCLLVIGGVAILRRRRS